MKILILGATGRTGRLVLAYALAAGYDVNVLVRNKAKLPAELNADAYTVFEGSPTNITLMKQAMSGCDICVSVLNISRTSNFPWSALTSDPTLMSDTMRVVVELAREQPLQRIITVSAWGVAETRPEIPGWFRRLIDNSKIGIAYKDHEEQEKVLQQQSVTPYTIIRPAGLANGKLHALRVSINNDPKPSLILSRASLARFIVDEIAQPKYTNRAVVVSK